MPVTEVILVEELAWIGVPLEYKYSQLACRQKFKFFTLLLGIANFQQKFLVACQLAVNSTSMPISCILYQHANQLYTLAACYQLYTPAACQLAVYSSRIGLQNVELQNVKNTCEVMEPEVEFTNIFMSVVAQSKGLKTK